MKGPEVAGAVLAAALIALLPSSRGRAQEGPACGPDVVAWAVACRAGEEPVRARECPPGHAILVVGPGALAIDVTHGGRDPFVRAGALGASPIGQFSSWTDVDARDRAAFDGLVRCLRERPDALAAALASSPRTGPGGDERGAGTSWPWRIVLAALFALGLAIPRVGLRGLAARGGPLLAASAVVLIARRLLVPESYFHQNGQGPLWVGHALGEPGAYGPGYAQAFQWIARGAADPDGAVFLAQGVLCSTIPAAALVIARAAGAPPVLAAALALAVALSPIHARLAQGESYFATCGALLAIAAAVAASGARAGAPRREQVVAAIAAGLLIAQAALIHPLSWLAAALVPIVVISAEGAPAERLRTAALVTAVIGAVVLVAAGPGMLAVVTGPLGADWLTPGRHGEGRGLPLHVAIAIAASAGAAIVAVRSGRWRLHAISIACLGATLVVGWAGDRLGAAPPWVHHAHGWLFLGPGLAALAALGRAAIPEGPAGERAARATAAIALVAALGWHVATRDETTCLPTDAREAGLVRAWRARIPEGAVVAHHERAGRRIVTLPLRAQRDLSLRVGEPTGDLTAAGRDVFLYRASLCSTDDARAACDALEAGYVLERRESARLPAIPSMRDLGYDREEVEVVLYRVRDRRSASTTDDGSSVGRDGR